MSNSNKILIALAIIILAVGAGVGVFYSGNQNYTGGEAQQPTTTTADEPTPTISTQTSPTPTEEPTDIPEDWVSYQLNCNGSSISFYHPSDYRIEESTDGVVNIYKEGPTQVEGTELFDGISLNIDCGTYSENSFRDFVENERQDAVDSPVSEAGEITEGEISGTRTLEYVETGLGEFTHIYFSFESGSYAHVSMLVADPTGVGFQEIADMIVLSISSN